MAERSWVNYSETYHVIGQKARTMAVPIQTISDGRLQLAILRPNSADDGERDDHKGGALLAGHKD